MYKEYEKGQAPEILERLATRIRAADAFIIVSGEYNHSIPPALSNLLDHFLEEYFWRPSAIVCYSAGAFGGVRAAMQLRAMLCELGTPSIPSLLPVPRVQDAFDEEGHPREEILPPARGAVPERARVVRPRAQDRKAGGCSLLSCGFTQGQRFAVPLTCSAETTAAEADTLDTIRRFYLRNKKINVLYLLHVHET